MNATIKYHRDGQDVRTVESGLTAEQAAEWIAAKATEVGQPMTRADGQPMVNESAEIGCGYYYVEA